MFPCKRGDKAPYVAGGFHSATTDEAQVREWWGRWPDAMIGVPTGAVSNLFVLDVDVDKGGVESLRALKEEYGPLPETTVIETGSGGMHFYFAHVDGYRCGVDLAPGLDIRTTGGYIIAPPSRSTAGPYKTVCKSEERPAPPAWLLGLVRDEQGRSATARGSAPTNPKPTYNDRPAHGMHNSAEAVSFEEGGPPIGEGGRNDALTRVAGALKRRGVDGDDLADALARINRARCSPPLPDAEVLAIARSVDRYPTGTPGPDADTLAELDRISRTYLDGREWRGTGGKSERSLVATAIQVMRERGYRIPAGVAVEVGVREFALRAATSKRGVIRGTKRLREKGIMRRDDSDRRDDQCGTIVLVSPAKSPVGGGRARCHHSPTEKSTGGGGDSLRGDSRGLPLTAPRLRWSGAGVLRVGKSGEAVIDALEDAGGRATVEDLAAAVGSARPRDLKRRIISRLEERGIAYLSGDYVSLVDDWRDALDEERQRSGEIDKAERDAEKFKREREAYRLKIAPDRGPSEEDMREERAAALHGRAKRAYNILMDERTAPGKMWRGTYWNRPEQLAGAVSAYAGDRGNPEAWKRWLPAVEEALALLNGEVQGAAA